MTRRACQLEQLQEIFGPLCILIGTQAYSYFWKWGQLTNLFVFVQRNPVQLDSVCNKPNSSRKWFILSYGPYRKHKSQFQIINQTNDRAIPRFFSQFPLAVLRACKGGCLTHEFKEKTQQKCRVGSHCLLTELLCSGLRWIRLVVGIDFIHRTKQHPKESRRGVQLLKLFMAWPDAPGVFSTRWPSYLKGW